MTKETMVRCGNCRWFDPSEDSVEPTLVGRCTFELDIDEDVVIPASFKREIVVVFDEGESCPAFELHPDKDTERRCGKCKHFNRMDGPNSCGYPPLNYPQAAWEFISSHHAHPVRTNALGGGQCQVFTPKDEPKPPDETPHTCGECRWFKRHATHAGECTFPLPTLPEAVEDIQWATADARGGAECGCFEPIVR